MDVSYEEDLASFGPERSGVVVAVMSQASQSQLLNVNGTHFSCQTTPRLQQQDRGDVEVRSSSIF